MLYQDGATPICQDRHREKKRKKSVLGEEKKRQADNMKGQDID